MTRYARGSRALGICDRCGQTKKLSTLRVQVIDSQPSGLRVCPSCMDIDHEQLRLSKVRADDAITLRHPRPDTSAGRTPLTDPITLPRIDSP